MGGNALILTSKLLYESCELSRAIVGIKGKWEDLMLAGCAYIQIK